MKTGLKVMSLCLLMLLGEQAFAQFNAILAHALPSTPLTTTCGGGTLIPDGWPIKIFMDIDSDGPDLDDPQPTVCTDPPFCATPPDGVNFNEFYFNGTVYLTGEGEFYSDPAFTCIGTIPGTGRFYLRIYEADNTTLLWTSTVFQVSPGYQEVLFQNDDWTCGQIGPQCIVVDETE
ncbi:MAG: hypothetical protein IPK53_20515 [bacterium]|nr:hypothetical protein [bacterium]